MSEKLRCPYCRKLIANGRWIGTLHLCLSPAERAQIDRERQQFEWQKREQMRVCRGGASMFDLANLADANSKFPPQETGT